MITRTFKLCLNAGNGSAPYINVNQYDEGETWLFELYSENGERYIPSSGAIVGVKSDGHGIVNTGTVDSEGRVVITETQQMTASAGRAIYELSIDGLTHGTANFIVAVERKPTDDAVMSDSDLSLIQEAIDSAEVIVEVIGDSDPSEVIGEHVNAWLDAHPEATTTVLDGAITAPKINSTLWDKLLVSEEASGNPAIFEDGADDVPVSSLKVALEPVQLGSGDPSPTNIRPIYPANGKNLFDEANATVYARYIDATSWRYSADSASYAFPCSPSTQYTVTAFNTNLTIFRIGCLNEAFDPSSTATLALTHVTRLTSASSITVTTDAETQYIVIQVNGTLANNAMIQIELGSASPYQPYQGIAVQQTGKNLLPNKIYKENAYRMQLGISSTSEWVSLKAGTYKVSVGLASGVTGTSVYWRTKTGSAVESTNITLSEDSNVHIWIFKDGLQISDVLWWQCELGSTATDYEPYTFTSYPYTLGQSVYGGTVDLATGVLTVTHGIVDMGSLTWTWNSTYGRFESEVVPEFVKVYTARTLAFLCSIFNVISDGRAIANVPNFGIYASFWSQGYTAFYVHDNRGLSEADFTTAVTGQLICCELAEPQTIQLTPTEVKTLLGYNNISSSGTVDVIYHADTKLYVDKMTNVDNNIIAPTEADFVATRNYTVNDLVIVNDTLYKVTANIASGSAITPNSNVQQTTLGALIKALS